MFDKLIFFIFIVSILFSCQNRRVVTETEFNNPAQNPTDMLKTMRDTDCADSSFTENHKRVATEIEFNNPPKNLIDMLNMMDFLDGVVPSIPKNYNRGKKEVFEDTVWRGSNTVLSGHSVYEKRLLFHNGYFIIEDGNVVWRFLAYGRYVADGEGRIACSILKRYFSPLDSLEGYYKVFLENDIITFIIRYDPALYYNQWQIVDMSGNEVFHGIGNQYTSPDMIYNNDGVELYKYDGGIKRCIDRVNLREKPSLDARIIAVLDGGRHIKVEARTIVREKIDNMEDYWYYFYYAVNNKYIPVYGYAFGGYFEEAAVPKEINPSDVLSGIDIQNINEADIKTMRERLIGNNIVNISSHDIGHKKYTKPYHLENVRLGIFSWYNENEYVSIFAFERLLGYEDAKAIHAIENVIIYPHKNMNLYCQQVLVWPGSHEESDDFTIWGLYKYPRDGFIGFEVTYYPQEVIIIDNKTGEMRLSPNRNNKYSFFTGL